MAESKFLLYFLATTWYQLIYLAVCFASQVSWANLRGEFKELLFFDWSSLTYGLKRAVRYVCWYFKGWFLKSYFASLSYRFLRSARVFIFLVSFAPPSLNFSNCNISQNKLIEYVRTEFFVHFPHVYLFPLILHSVDAILAKFRIQNYRIIVLQIFKRFQMSKTVR